MGQCGGEDSLLLLVVSLLSSIKFLLSLTKTSPARFWYGIQRAFQERTLRLKWLGIRCIRSNFRSWSSLGSLQLSLHSLRRKVHCPWPKFSSSSSSLIEMAFPLPFAAVSDGAFGGGFAVTVVVLLAAATFSGLWLAGVGWVPSRHVGGWLLLLIL